MNAPNIIFYSIRGDYRLQRKQTAGLMWSDTKDKHDNKISIYFKHL